MTPNQPSSRSSKSSEATLSVTFWRSLGTILQGQTYKNLLYLVLAFPLGLVYFVGLIFGLALGFGLVITWIGLPILLVTLLIATAVANFELMLANSLGGVNVTEPTVLDEFDIPDGLVFPGNGFLDAVKALLTAPATRMSIALAFGKFGFGLLSVVALTVSGAVTSAFLAAPFIYDNPDVLLGVGGLAVGSESTVGLWVIDTFVESVVAAGIGVVFLFLALNILNSLAGFHAQYIVKLLEVGDEQM